MVKLKGRLFNFLDSTFKESKYAEFQAQPLLFLDETIATARIDHTVTERKLSNLEGIRAVQVGASDRA